MAGPCGVRVNSLTQAVPGRQNGPAGFQVCSMRRQVSTWVVEFPQAPVSNFAFASGTFFVSEMKEERKKHGRSLVNKLDLIDCIRPLHQTLAKHTLV